MIGITKGWNDILGYPLIIGISVLVFQFIDFEFGITFWASITHPIEGFTVCLFILNKIFCFSVMIMSRETVSFAQSGPTPVCVDEGNLPSRTGCYIITLTFPQPTQVLFFHTMYCKKVELKVARTCFHSVIFKETKVRFMPKERLNTLE